MRPRCKILALVAMFLSTSTLATEFVWTGDPIQIQLTVGVERRVVIDETDEIRVGMPATLQATLLAKSVGNSLWLTASAPIHQERILISAPPHRDLIVAVITALPDLVTKPTASIRFPDRSSPHPILGSPGFAALTRWTIQQLYAPARLRTNLDGVTRAAVADSPMPLFKCAFPAPTHCPTAVRATPIETWRTAVHYVTAFHLENTSDEPIILDPRDIRGRWRTAAFVRSRLLSAGDPNATTTAVLISDTHPSEAVEQ